MNNTIGSKTISRVIKSEKETGLAGAIIFALLVFGMDFIAIAVAKENPLLLLFLTLVAVGVGYIPIILRRRFPQKSLIAVFILVVAFLAPLGLTALFKDNPVTLVTLSFVVLSTVCAQIYFLRSREHQILDQLMNHGCEIKLPTYLPIRNCQIAVELMREKSSDSIILKVFYYSTKSKQKERLTVKAYFRNGNASISGSMFNDNRSNVNTKFEFLNKDEVKKPSSALGTGIDTKAFFRQSGVDYELWGYGISQDKLEKAISSLA